jgi:hypothetical protein
MNHDYWHQRIALLTQHGKEALIAPLLEPATGCSVVNVTEIDTDAFGTFTREIDREGSQLEAARAKARAALSHSGLQLAIASEGSFVPDPFAGAIPWNIEVVLLIDQRQNLELIGNAQGPARSGQGLVRTKDELMLLVQGLGFPEHQLCIRPNQSEDPRVIKGLGSAEDLLDAFDKSMALSNAGLVFVESDLRAHCNPTRQAMICRAAKDLLQKMLSACPACGLPGFTRTGHRPGRPCRVCASPTREPMAYIWSCGICHHTFESRDAMPPLADPGPCDRCNP